MPQTKQMVFLYPDNMKNVLISKCKKHLIPEQLQSAIHAWNYTNELLSGICLSMLRSLRQIKDSYYF